MVRTGARPRGVLALRGFRRLWLGQTLSSVGDQMFPVAAAIAVMQRGGDATDIGLVLAARTVALVALLPLAGVWADRLPRRRVVVASDALRGLVVAGLALTWTRLDTLTIAALVFAVGAGEAFFRPAQGALLADLLPAEQRNAGNALMNVSMRAASFAGPALSGVLVVRAGAASALLIDALTFGWSLAMVAGIREPVHERPPARPILREVRDGLDEVRSRPWLATLMLLSTAHVLLVIAPTTVLLPIVGRQAFGSDAPYSAALAALGLGGAAGALMAGRWRPPRPGVVAMTGLLAYSLVPLSLLFPFSASWLVIAHFVAAVGAEPFVVFWYTAIQTAVAPNRLAKVLSLDWLATFAPAPVALAVTGYAVALTGEGPVLAVAVAASTLPPLLALLVPGVATLRDSAPVDAVCRTGGARRS